MADESSTRDTFQIVETALYDLWSVVNDLSEIRESEPKYFRVTVFGSARMAPGDPVYEQTCELARSLSEMGCDIVTGGGPGVMQAANEGALLGDPHNQVKSFGLPIELPQEEQANPFVERVYRHRTFFSRLHQFVRLSRGYVVMPGGIGTTLETMLVWQLLQVRHLEDIPLVFVGEMWDELVAWASRNMSDPKMADPEDFQIPICVRDSTGAVEAIRPYVEAFKESKERR